MDEETWPALDAGASAAIDVEIVDADRASASPAPNVVLRRLGRRPCVKRVARLFFIVFLSDVPVGPFADILGAVARGKPTIG